MRLAAKWVLPVSDPPIENGIVEINGNRITAVGRHGAADIDLGDVVLLPGLINAHCHFDYTHFAGRVPYRGRFTDWIHDIVALKAQQTLPEFSTGIQAGIKLALETGTTTVVNIESFPELITQIPQTPLRVIWCPELIDLNQIIHDLPVVGGGLSPHAPYTASGALYRQCAKTGRFVTTHVAESLDEDEMFRQGRGPLYDACRSLGRPMTDCGHSGPVELLHNYGVLGNSCLAVHANYLSDSDVQLLAATGTSVVHCPKTHHFFERATAPLVRLLQAGVNVCLGTDSLASNNSLNLFEEMRELARVFPQLLPDQILALATTQAARALQLSAPLGRIAVGAAADLIAVPASGYTDPYVAVVFAEKPVTFMMIDGKVVFR